ncbi:MAG TPA: glycosyltransferase [Solirubrobacteraceae bacterium]|nr:glycosyltransferase [Solirubrobacteraceae bacterium]
MSHGDRLRIVTLVDRLASGGAERLAVELAMRLDPQRFERVICATRRPTGDNDAVVRPQLRAAGVELMSLDRTSKLDLWRWRPLVGQVRRGEVDVLHAHMFGSNLWASMLGRLDRELVVVAHDHGWDFDSRWVRRRLDPLISRRADAVIAVSESDRRRLIAEGGMSPDKVIVLPNGVDADLGGDGPRARHGLGLGSSDVLVVAVGRLDPAKGFATLVSAFEHVTAAVPQARLLIAGDGPGRDGLKTLVDNHGLSGTVTLLGHRDDVPDLLAAADLAVSSSVSEASPLAVMEYMASGLPIVATGVGGVPELIESGKHGVLVEPSDPRALASAIIDRLRDPAGSKAMGRAARDRQRAHFDVRRTIAELERLYLELGARRRTPQPSSPAGKDLR